MPELLSLRGVLTGHQARICDLCWSPDGRRFVSASDDGSLGIWEPGTLAEPRMFRAHDQAITSVEVSPSGAVFASASLDTTVRCWAAATGEQLSLFHGPAPFRSISWAPDESRVCAVQTKRVHIFSRQTGTLDDILFEHDRWARRAIWLPDGTILSGGDDGQLIMWNVQTGRPFERRKLERGGIRDIAYDRRHARVAIGVNEGRVELWAMDPRQDLGRIETSPGLERLSFSSDGSVLAVRVAGGRIELYATGSRRLALAVSEDAEPAGAAAFHPRRPVLAVARGSTIHLLNVDIPGMLSAAGPYAPQPPARDTTGKPQLGASPVSNRPRDAEGSVDLLIVVGADREDDAVQAVAAGGQSTWRAISPTLLPSGYGLPVHTRTFVSAQGHALRVALTRAPVQRGTATAAVAAVLIDHLRPVCLAMCGVCAGRPQWTRLGDVIIADRVYRYAGRQLTDRRVLDSTTYNLHLAWRQAAERFTVPQGPWIDERPVERQRQEEWILLKLADRKNPTEPPDELKANGIDWEQAIAGLWGRGLVMQGDLELTPAGRTEARRLQVLYPRGLPKAPPPRVHVGPVATLDDLVARDGIWQELEQSQGMIHGLDMEASDVGFVGFFQNVPRVVVAKGVMDYAEPERQYGFRSFAARAAAEVLLGFVRQHIDDVAEFRQRIGER